MMKELTYFQAPLVLLKDINEDFSRGMQTFIAFSIVDFALKAFEQVYNKASI